MPTNKTPGDRQYTLTHEWVKQAEGGILLGVTAPLLERLGTLISVELPGPDDEMMLGVPFGTMESIGGLHEMMPPGDARVLETNEAMLWDLDGLRADPYDKGWLLKVQARDPEQFKGLIGAKAYEEHCKNLWGKGSKSG